MSLNTKDVRVLKVEQSYHIKYYILFFIYTDINVSISLIMNNIIASFLIITIKMGISENIESAACLLLAYVNGL